MPHYENQEVGKANVPFEVPSSWVWCRLEELCNIKGGKRIPKGKGFSPQVTEHIYLRVTNMKNRTISLDDLKYIDDDVFQEIKNYTISSEDLYLTIAGTIGDVGEIPQEVSGMNLTENAAKLTNIVCDRLYLMYSLLSTNSQEHFSTKFHQVAQPKLSIETASSTLLPLPPLSEQQRIVMEIEKWFALIDQIEQGKSDLQTTIKQTKSKILDLAIHGKLVPQDPNDEPAIELLKRINPDFTPCDNGHYTQLPDGWTICRLEQVADILDNLRKPINASERDSRIKNRQIDELYPYYGATGQVGLIDDYVVNGHYLLLGEDGAPFLDKNAIKAYSISGKSWVNNHAHILSPKIDLEFLQYSLNQIDYSEYVNGSTRLKLTQTDMRSIKIMLPPLAEQKRIKFKIQTLFSQLDLIMGSL